VYGGLLALCLSSPTFASTPPVAASDAAALDEGASITLPVLDNDSDSESSLSYSRVQIVGTPVNGWAYVKTSGAPPLGIVFTHDGSETDTAEFEYRVGDGTHWSDPARVTLTIRPLNDPPEAVADEFEFEERETRILDVLANDIDADSTLTYDRVEIVGIPFYGTATVTPTGVHFVQDGTEDVVASFRYRVSDGEFTSEEVNVQITVVPTNNPPVATADSAEVHEDETGIIPVLDNDWDAETTLDYDAVRIVESFGGSATVGPDGVAFTPSPGTETVGGFQYVVNDGIDDSNVAGVGITIVRRNDPPIAADDQAIFDEGEGRSIRVLDNDTDPDSVLDYHHVRIVGTPVNGRATVGAFGVAFAHDGSETTEASFQYTVSDGEHTTEPATVRITVRPVNDPPLARRDTATVVEGGQVRIPVLDNDEDLDDPRLYHLTWIVAGSFRGTTTVGEDAILFQHDGGEWPDAEFYYRFTDGLVVSDPAQVWITVLPVNDPPIAVDDRGSLYAGQSVELAVLENDIDPDSDLRAGEIEIVGQPQNGSVEVLGHRVRFTHDGSKERFGRFRYRISDGEATSNIATALLWIRVPGDLGGGTLDWPEPCNDTDCDTGEWSDSDGDRSSNDACGGCSQPNTPMALLPMLLAWAAARRRTLSAV
jgi:hypothetical protein